MDTYYIHGRESCAHSIQNKITLELRQEMGDESKTRRTAPNSSSYFLLHQKQEWATLEYNNN